jgi:hypothetical protein
VTEVILSGVTWRRHCAADWLRALLDHDPAACPHFVQSSVVRQLARIGLIVLAGRQRTTDGWRVAWSIRDRRAVLDLLDRLDRFATTYLFPE